MAQKTQRHLQQNTQTFAIEHTKTLDTHAKDKKTLASEHTKTLDTHTHKRHLPQNTQRHLTHTQDKKTLATEVPLMADGGLVSNVSLLSSFVFHYSEVKQMCMVAPS